ncbi:MAG: carboxypeptidase regulatory-like domain-containing protein [Gemmatimonadota bacterium]|nr:carboxypeptidase-like regulatory domain-containing protein [Gemmatimonadota bacterium]
MRIPTSLRSRSWAQRPPRRAAGSALGVLALLAPALLAAAPGSGLRTARVVGIVFDAGRGPEAPLADAWVQVEGRRPWTFTDTAGAFVLEDLAPGTVVLSVGRVGYTSRTDTLELRDDESLQVSVPLAVEPVELAPLTVTVRSRVLETRGFYLRRAGGSGGVFFTREDVEERRIRDVTELLDGLPGVSVIQDGVSGARVVFRNAVSLRQGGMCDPSLFLDGVKSQIRVYDLILDPAHIEGIEVYRGGVPGRFNDPCGAVLVWTRVP